MRRRAGSEAGSLCGAYRRDTHVERQGSLLKHKVDLLRAAVAADGAAVALEQPALRVLALRGGVARVSRERDWCAAANDRAIAAILAPICEAEICAHQPGGEALDAHAGRVGAR